MGVWRRRLSEDYATELDVSELHNGLIERCRLQERCQC